MSVSIELLVKRLAAGHSCTIESCSLHPDVELGVIWGVDPYGLDFVARNQFAIGDEESARAAIERAIAVDQGDNLHDQLHSSAC